MSKNDYRSKKAFFENYISCFRSQSNDIRSQYEELRLDYDEKCILCEELQNQFLVQEEANINASSEVKILKEARNLFLLLLLLMDISFSQDIISHLK